MSCGLFLCQKEFELGDSVVQVPCPLLYVAIHFGSLWGMILWL
jgi:hypothetical protein